MSRAFLACALAVCVVSAPLAAELCHFACARGHHDSQSRSPEGARHAQPVAHHHAAHSASTTGNASLTGDFHACAHADAVTPGTRHLERPSTAPVAPPVTHVTPHEAGSPRLPALDDRHGPPRIAVPLSPLRI